MSAMPDDLAEALDSVDPIDEQDGDGDPIGGVEAHGDPEPEQFPDESSSKDGGLWDWATSVPDGSHRDWDRTDLWDPDGGGRARLAFHLSTIYGDGEGLPNGVGVLLGVVELYWTLAQQSTGGGDRGGGDGETEAPNAETVSRETAEAHV